MKHFLSLLMTFAFVFAGMAQTAEEIDNQVYGAAETAASVDQSSHIQFVSDEDLSDFDEKGYDAEAAAAGEAALKAYSEANGGEGIWFLNDAQLWDGAAICNLLLRFLFNLFVGWILIHFAYFRKSKRKDWYVTFMLFLNTMFLLIMLMGNMKLQIGFTLGLFAIFGMIRYRTETVPIREMTYLFVIIGLSVINGLAMDISILQLAIANLLLVGLCFLLERFVGNRTSTAKIILYDKIDLIVPEKRDELMADLKKRTGIENIEHIEIGHIDFLRDVAYIKIYYSIPAGEYCTINDQVKPKA